MTSDLLYSRSKIELDVEKHVLNTTVRLSDGTDGLVFSRSNKNASGHFVYSCHLCGTSNLSGERILQTHISGKKHQNRLAQPTINAETFRAPILPKAKIQMQIAPGEPVPPGFENEVKLIATLQSTIDRYKGPPLIGLEYIVELTFTDSGSPNYICILCDKRSDFNNIMTHLISYDHRIKYLEKHFPSVIRELAPYRFDRVGREQMPQVVLDICEAIEGYHGRLCPNVFENGDFHRNQTKYEREILSDRHIDEKLGKTFIDVIDKKRLLNTINNKRGRSPSKSKPPKRIKSERPTGRNSFDSVSSISSDSFNGRSLSRSPVGRSLHRRDKLRSMSPYRGGNSRSKSPISRFNRNSDSRQILPSPRELIAQADAIAKERYKWEKYRALVEIAINELEKEHEEHMKIPEKHPLYPDEWKTFWNRRYKELQAEKKDPVTHDYKPEWIEFWTHRMKELHEEAIDNKKNEIRKKLKLPEDGKERTDELKKQYAVKIARKDPVAIIDLDDVESVYSNPSMKRVRGRSTHRSRSRSPGSDEYSRSSRRSLKSFSRDREELFDRDIRARQREKEFEREREREQREKRYRAYVEAEKYNAKPAESYDDWAKKYYGPNKTVFIREVEETPRQIENDEPLTIVSVLRMLTALEDQLGSLGPKVIDLLAKALALEKIKANSADDLLLNDDNTVLFETVKEKLKGQIACDLLEPYKLSAVKRAITKVAAIIHLASEKQKARKMDSVKKVETMIDKKMDIVKNLASALSSNGRHDIAIEQLEQLVCVYLKIEKMSKDQDKIITTAMYLSDLDEIERKKNELREKRAQPKTVPTIKKNLFSDEFQLTDTDLEILLQNFKNLSPDEQEHLIGYMKRLESTDPIRVDRLRRYVNDDLVMRDNDQSFNIDDMEEQNKNRPDNQMSRGKFSFSFDKNKERDQPLTQSKRLIDSDDDEDYSYEDVVKAASRNIRSSQSRENRMSFRDDEISNSSRASNFSTDAIKNNAKNIIDNIMGSLKNTQSIRGTSVEQDKSSVSSISTINTTGPQSKLPFYQQQNTLYSTQPGTSNYMQNYPQHQSANFNNVQPIQNQQMYQQNYQQNANQFGDNQSQQQSDANAYYNNYY